MSETAERVRIGAQVDEASVRGKCPACGEPVVSNTYYVTERGYLVVWECVGAVKTAPTCEYRRVL